MVEVHAVLRNRLKREPDGMATKLNHVSLRSRIALKAVRAIYQELNERSCRRLI